MASRSIEKVKHWIERHRIAETVSVSNVCLTFPQSVEGFSADLETRGDRRKVGICFADHPPRRNAVIAAGLNDGRHFEVHHSDEGRYEFSVNDHPCGSMTVTESKRTWGMTQHVAWLVECNGRSCGLVRRETVQGDVIVLVTPNGSEIRLHLQNRIGLGHFVHAIVRLLTLGMVSFGGTAIAVAPLVEAPQDVPLSEDELNPIFCAALVLRIWEFGFEV